MSCANLLLHMSYWVEVMANNKNLIVYWCRFATHEREVN